MRLAARVHTDRYLPLFLAGAAVLCALLVAPLIRSLPEQGSMVVFYLLTPLQIGLGIGGLVLSPAVWQRTADRRALAAFGLSLASFVILAINFYTPWLWPYATP